MGSRQPKRKKGRRPRELRGTRRVAARTSAEANVREVAVWVLEHTLATSSSADAFLDQARLRCHPKDRSLLVELVRGTLAWLARIDDVLEQASGRPMAKVESALHGLLRIGAYQLLFLERIPPHAVVNEAVEHAHRITHRGAGSFVNGVLRRISRSRRLSDWPVERADDVVRLAVEHSHPEFLVRRWIEAWGTETTLAVLEANNRRKAPHLLAFREHGGRELLAESLIDEGVEVVASERAPLGLRVVGPTPWASITGATSFRRGEFYIQDEASQIAALVPPVREGERVLDLAAAPGGKAYSMRAFEPSSRHVASDVSVGRLLRMRANNRRLGLQIPLLVSDAAQPPFAGEFDRVVVDAPCSGTGTFRKNPELRWRVSPDEITRLATAGAGLLRGASLAVAPGGLLIWITCSLEIEENERVVTTFLHGQDAFETVDLASTLPACLSDHVAGPGIWRMLPGGDHDGFTVSVLRRAS